jgi:LmbE family N-acetylglucosaminyl deacetylase
LTKEAVEAVDKYIAEREEKRKRGLNVPKHTCYKDGDGPLSFAGIRNINGRALALIKREDNDVVMILPVDQTAAYRLKRVAIGAAVTVTAWGTVRTPKGRGR